MDCVDYLFQVVDFTQNRTEWLYYCRNGRYIFIAKPAQSTIRRSGELFRTFSLRVARYVVCLVCD